MNNPHQELIEKSVDEFCDFDFYTDGGNIGAKEVEPWLRKTLQATIDTVLERERERAGEYMTPEGGAAYLEALTPLPDKE